MDCTFNQYGTKNIDFWVIHFKGWSRCRGEVAVHEDVAKTNLDGSNAVIGYRPIKVDPMKTNKQHFD